MVSESVPYKYLAWGSYTSPFARESKSLVPQTSAKVEFQCHLAEANCLATLVIVWQISAHSGYYQYL